MTTFQKVIKVLAIILGVLIITAIIKVVLTTIGVISGLNYINENKYTETFNQEYTNINSIELEIDSADIVIKEGNTFSVDAKNVSKRFKSKTSNGKLIIEEKNKKWKKSIDSKVVISIPKTENINELNIENGAGQLSISNLSFGELEISQGAGTLIIENITSNKTEIEGGAGEIVVNNSTLNDLKLDSGVGSVDIEAKLTGKSEINCGVGAISLNLIGTEEDYTLSIEKGIGSIKIEGVEQKNNTIYGSGLNKIEIEGGVGEIKVDFTKSNVIDGMLTN